MRSKIDAMTGQTICRVTNVELKHPYYHTHPISVQLRNALTSLGTETFGGIYPFQLHYSLTLQHHYIITILFK